MIISLRLRSESQAESPSEDCESIRLSHTAKSNKNQHTVWLARSQAGRPRSSSHHLQSLAERAERLLVSLLIISTTHAHTLLFLLSRTSVTVVHQRR
eukprot:894533-Rhodomonas_salina.1